jgi:hypothetical protein
LALAGETFDIVYTGMGVTQWIPDIDSCAHRVAPLVAPFHGLERGEDGLWRIPADRFQIPLMFSLRAAKNPASDIWAESSPG